MTIRPSQLAYARRIVAAVKNNPDPRDSFGILVWSLVAEIDRLTDKIEEWQGGTAAAPRAPTDDELRSVLNRAGFMGHMATPPDLKRMRDALNGLAAAPPPEPLEGKK